MLSILLRGAVVAAVLVALWLTMARPAVMAMDRVSLTTVASLPAGRIGWNGETLQFGEGREGFSGPDAWDGPGLLTGAHMLGLNGQGRGGVPAVTLAVDARGQLVVSVGDAAPLVLAARDGTLTGEERPIAAFAAGPDDVVTMTVTHSRMSWPVIPRLSFGYLDGPGTTWRRSFLYHLTWRKPSGAALDLLWRFEQAYDRGGGWGALGNEGDATGVIGASLRLAPL